MSGDFSSNDSVTCLKECFFFFLLNLLELPTHGKIHVAFVECLGCGRLECQSIFLSCGSELCLYVHAVQFLQICAAISI